jgi:hypothetical protein
MQGWMKQVYEQQVAAAKTPQEKQMAEFQVRNLEMQQNIPYYAAHQIASLVGGAILCVLLIVGGIGLLRVAPWGRTVSLIYAPLSILTQVISVIYLFAVFIPAVTAFYNEEVARINNPAFSAGISLARAIIYVVPVAAIVGLVYPTLVLIWMLRAPVVEAFRTGGVEDSEPKDYHDSDRREPPPHDDRPWSERGNEGGEGITPK